MAHVAPITPGVASLRRSEARGGNGTGCHLQCLKASLELAHLACHELVKEFSGSREVEDDVVL